MPSNGATGRTLEFSQLTKTFATPKEPLTVVDGFDLTMRKGEFVSLIGHSGCGKPTVRSMVAGFADVTTGHTLEVDIPRPRTRQTLLEHPRYHAHREELLSSLESGPHGAAQAA